MAAATNVAEHYNAVPETGLAVRTESRIFFMRNYNNWTKSILIADFLNRIRKEKGRDCEISVLDMCCGKGGDLLKWKKGGISRLVCADIAGVSIRQCEDRYNSMIDRNKQQRRPEKMFECFDFIEADCGYKRLKDIYSKSDARFDLCSVQFSLHYAFETLERARCMLKNACESLNVGGYLVGTIPDANAIVHRLREAKSTEFENSVFKISFDDIEVDCLDDNVTFPLFGAKYHFSLEQVVDCPEYLVHFPLLEHLLAELGMKLVYKENFSSILDHDSKEHEGRKLLGIMKALEPYPGTSDTKLIGDKDAGDYDDAEVFYKQKCDEQDERSRSISIVYFLKHARPVLRAG